MRAANNPAALQKRLDNFLRHTQLETCEMRHAAMNPQTKERTLETWLREKIKRLKSEPRPIQSIKWHKYFITVIGCIVYAAVLSAWVHHTNAADGFLWLQLLLLVLWPFWIVFLWCYSRGMKTPLRLLAIIAPLLFGGYLLYLCGLLIFAIYILDCMLNPGSHF